MFIIIIKIIITIFITLIWKSVEIHANCLLLIDAIVQKNRKILSVFFLRFQNRCNKVVIELCVVQFLSEIILVTSNETRTAHLFDLKSRVWFQTKLHFIYLNYISNQSVL